MDDEFIVRVLEGMGFGTFVAERGNPYRACDIFDEVSTSTVLHSLPCSSQCYNAILAIYVYHI